MLGCCRPLPSAAVAVRIAVTASDRAGRISAAVDRGAVRAVNPVQAACAPSVRWLRPCVTRLAAARFQLDAARCLQDHLWAFEHGSRSPVATAQPHQCRLHPELALQSIQTLDLFRWNLPDHCQWRAVASADGDPAASRCTQQTRAVQPGPARRKCAGVGSPTKAGGSHGTRLRVLPVGTNPRHA